MTTLCFNSARFVRGWFAALEGVQERMAQISHLTATNTKEFSKQKMGDLLLPNSPGFALRVDNLKQYCQQTLGLLVHDGAIDAKKDFLWFVGEISVPADKRLLPLFFCVAEKFGPAGIPTSPDATFAALTLAAAFHDRPMSENPGLRTLDELLRQSLGPAFYSDAAVLADRKRTIRNTILAILT